MRTGFANACISSSLEVQWRQEHELATDVSTINTERKRFRSTHRDLNTSLDEHDRI